MTDLLDTALAVASVKFKWSKDGQVYDYLIPEGLELVAGDKVIVTTKRGETEVEVVEIKSASDKATAKILRKSDTVEGAPAETKPVEDWNF